MPDMNVAFGGQVLTQPGAYYTDDVSAAANTALALVPPAILIGNCYGLPKNVPATFTSQEDLTAAIRGGPLAKYLPFLYDPSPSLNGASIVTVINVANNTAAGITLKNSAGQPVLSIPSANWGAAENLKQVSVAPGSIGGVLMTLFDGYSNQTYQADNLGLALTISYTGQASGVTLAVTPGVSLTLVSPTASENVTVPLGSGGYQTVADVVNYLNGTAAFTAQVISNGALPTTALDTAAGRTIAQNGTANIGASLNDIVFWLNTQAQAFTTSAAVVSGVTSQYANLPAPVPLTHMSGGTNVPPTLADYAAGFNAALNTPGWVVFADSNAASVQSLGAQHVKTSSSIVNRRPRRFVTGSTLGMTVSQAGAASRALGLKECTFCYPGITANDPNTGLSTLYDGLAHAAATAGIMAGNPVATPLTNKALSATGVEVSISASDLNTLQANGVQALTVPDATGAPTILSDVTCWQTDNNPENVFNQQVAIRQYIAYVMIQAMSPYTGAIESSLSIAIQKKAAVAALNGLLVNASGSTGVLNSWDTSSLKLNYTSSGQVTSVSFNATPVGQNRFTLITNYIQPLTLSA